MKLLLLACLAVLASARPQQQFLPEPTQYTSLQEAGILRMEMNQNEDGSFQYGFETTDPIQQDVTGQIKQIGEEVGVVMQGSYSFVAKDQNGNDVPVTVNWTADENGFRAESDAIPEGADGSRANTFSNEGGF